jgi:hypothetical protein
LLYVGVFGGTGYGLSKLQFDKMTSPAPFPGSEEDEYRMNRIETFFEEQLPIVRQLREDPDYIEVDVYGNYSWVDKEQRLTSGPLSGSGGLAFQVRGFSLFVVIFLRAELWPINAAGKLSLS